MKKLTALLLILVLSFSACAGTDDSSDSDDTAVNNTGSTANGNNSVDGSGSDNGSNSANGNTTDSTDIDTSGLSIESIVDAYIDFSLSGSVKDLKRLISAELYGEILKSYSLSEKEAEEIINNMLSGATNEGYSIKTDIVDKAAPNADAKASMLKYLDENFGIKDSEITDLQVLSAKISATDKDGKEASHTQTFNCFQYKNSWVCYDALKSVNDNWFDDDDDSNVQEPEYNYDSNDKPQFSQPDSDGKSNEAEQPSDNGHRPSDGLTDRYNTKK